MRVTFVCAVALGCATALLTPGTTTARQGVGQEPTLEEHVGRLQDGDFAVRLKALNYIGALKLLDDPARTNEDYRIVAGAPLSSQGGDDRSLHRIDRVIHAAI
jgi:hypothetical protein